MENEMKGDGVRPPFFHGAQAGSALDQILGSSFGLIALVIGVCYVFLARQFFRQGSMNTDRSGLILGIRYGMFTTMLSLAAGIWISVLQTRYTGEAGNIIWFHGFGFHGVQFMPLIAWLMEKQNRYTGHRLIHISGLAWSLFIILIGWQTLLGRSISKMSFLMVVATTLFVFYVLVFVLILIEVLKGRKNKEMSFEERV